MSTKITTPTLIDLPGETLTSENTHGVILPKGTTGERPGSISVEYLVVAGGGGGGSRTGASGSGSGGGGAGGLLTSWPSGTALSVALGASIDITVGEGGIGASTPNTYTKGGDGGDSIFASITATGGGGGASGPFNGNTGGSGGGSGYSGTGGNGTIGQGNNGGSASSGSAPYAAGGGGGAGGVGGNAASSSVPGTGGAGLTIDITNASVTYAAGGDGCVWTDGGSSNESNNTGNGSDGAATAAAGNGGSGVVILRYPDTYTIVETTSVLTFTTDSTSVANTKITTFTAGTSGVIQFTPITTPSAGEFRYNTTDKLVEFYNGSTWKQIATEYISGQPSTCICNLLTTATALYQFEDNINDTCGSHNLSTFNNSAYGTGKFGKAADFNGTNASILSSSGSPEIFTNASGGTISFWCNPDNLSGNQDLVSAHNGSWSGNYGWIIRVVSSGINMYVYNTGAGNALSTNPLASSSTIPAGSWSHVAVVTEGKTTGDTIKLYINGSLSSGGSTTFSSTPNFSSTQVIELGDSHNNHWYEGLIDQLRVYPSALSDAQILQLYNEAAC